MAAYPQYGRHAPGLQRHERLGRTYPRGARHQEEGGRRLCPERQQEPRGAAGTRATPSPTVLFFSGGSSSDYCVIPRSLATRAQKLLKSDWGLQVDTRTPAVPARILDPERLYFGGNAAIAVDARSGTTLVTNWVFVEDRF